MGQQGLAACGSIGHDNDPHGADSVTGNEDGFEVGDAPSPSLLRPSALSACCRTRAEQIMALELPCSQDFVESIAAALDPDQAQDSDHASDADSELSAHNQDHLMTFADALTEHEFDIFAEEVRRIDQELVADARHQGIMALHRQVTMSTIAPPMDLRWNKPQRPTFQRGLSVTKESQLMDRRAWEFRQLGFYTLSKSRVAVVLLAGSNDRRLGNGRPTGIADLGLLSGKCLFQIYCERLVRLQHLTKRRLVNYAAQKYTRTMRHRETLRAEQLREREMEADKDKEDGRRGSIDKSFEAEALHGAVPPDSVSSGLGMTEGSPNPASRSFADSELGDETSAASTSISSFIPPARPKAERSFAREITSSASSDDEDSESSGTSSSNSRKSPNGRRRPVFVQCPGASSDSAETFEIKPFRDGEVDMSIPLYIMCSEENLDETREWFKTNSFFGLEETDVSFFIQGVMPAVNHHGQIMLEERNLIARHPDGGGGVFPAMLAEGVIADMKSRFVDYIFVAPQDNLLLRIADPMFIGYCVESKLKAAVKCTSRLETDESLGILCNRLVKHRVPADEEGDGEPLPPKKIPAIIEPREIDLTTFQASDKTGTSVLNMVSLGQFCFTVRFAEYAGEKMPVRWHAIRRRQPYVNVRNGQRVSPSHDALNGVRLEMFVGDALELTHAAGGFCVERAQELARIRPGESHEGRREAIAYMSVVHRDWLVAGGARFDVGIQPDAAKNRCEVSPLVSYSGEDLVGLGARGEMLELPLHFKGFRETEARQVEELHEARLMRMRRNTDRFALEVFSEIREKEADLDSDRKHENTRMMAKRLTLGYQASDNTIELPSTPDGSEQHLSSERARSPSSSEDDAAAVEQEKETTENDPSKERDQQQEHVDATEADHFFEEALCGRSKRKGKEHALTGTFMVFGIQRRVQFLRDADGSTKKSLFGKEEEMAKHKGPPVGTDRARFKRYGDPGARQNHQDPEHAQGLSLNRLMWPGADGPCLPSGRSRYQWTVDELRGRPVLRARGGLENKERASLRVRHNDAAGARDER